MVKVKKNDILLLAVVFIIGGGILFFQNSNQKAGRQVVITVDGKEFKVLKLNEDQQIKIKCGHGHYNVLCVHDGKADMIESDCKNQVCVKSKAIQHVGESIVCLPHKVIVKVIEN